MILGLNTAFTDANIVLIDNDKVFDRKINARLAVAEHVLKTIDELCEEAHRKATDITEIAVVVGVGSFTGVRIGVAIAKGFACAKVGITLFPISSLELMAYIYIQNHNNDFVCVINALSGLYFVCEFGGSGIKLGTERMIDKDELDKIMLKKVCLTGDLDFADADFVMFDNASFVKYIRSLPKDKAVSVENLEPIYLRQSQAEAELSRKKKIM